MNQASIFLLSKKGRKYEFTDFPKDLYIDTCFWNEVYGVGNISFRTNCADFLIDCAGNDTAFYTSGVVHEELMHVIKNSMIKEYAYSHNIKVHRYKDNSINMKKLFESVYNSFPNIVQDIDSEIKRIRNIIDEKTYFLEHINNEEFIDDVNKLIASTNYQINTADAKHVLIAHYNEINSFATLDGDFWMLDNANIYAPPLDFYNINRLGRRNTFLKYDSNII